MVTGSPHSQPRIWLTGPKRLRHEQLTARQALQKQLRHEQAEEGLERQRDRGDQEGMAERAPEAPVLEQPGIVGKAVE
jgi:hypothetical protein